MKLIRFLDVFVSPGETPIHDATYRKVENRFAHLEGPGSEKGSVSTCWNRAYFREGGRSGTSTRPGTLSNVIRQSEGYWDADIVAGQWGTLRGCRKAYQPPHGHGERLLQIEA